MIRNTTYDYIHSFEKYDKENEYFYFNIWRGRHKEDYEWIRPDMFDAVIFDNTVLALRTAESHWDNFIELIKKIRDHACLKLVFVQDDYTKTDGVWKLVEAVGADAIFTVMREFDNDKFYSGSVQESVEIINVLTGYVEEEYERRIQIDRHKKRTLDVVYRAKKLPYQFGRSGQLKYEVGERVKAYLRNTDLKYDIESTDDSKKVIYGDAWFEFLASSRTVLGCLSGASIADYDGTIKRRVDEYCESNPLATYQEVKEQIIPEIDEDITGVVSPRIFEAALMKTCQVLVGSDYQDILRPDIDYIALDEDYGNIDEVIKKIRDIDYCQGIADSCYQRVVGSGKYSYQEFVNRIINWIRGRKQEVLPYSEEISKMISYHCEQNNTQVDKEIKEFFEKRRVS